MSKRSTSIPVNSMANDWDEGITIEKVSLHNLQPSIQAIESHRHDRHSFFLLESGVVHMEIDFEKYKIKAPSIVYMHPDQVHRTTAFEKVTVSSLALSNETLHPEYLQILADITPTEPLFVNKETFSIFAETIALCIKFSERKSDKLYRSLLKDSCNALVALFISQFIAKTTSSEKSSRFDIVTKSFREILELNYTELKRPAAYAQLLNLSTPYLNECVKNTSGHSVSHHIQQRVMLEAKRLLCHSDKSVKEIAAELGYDDYPYFSRLFTKITGMTAVAFRHKNLD